MPTLDHASPAADRSRRRPLGVIAARGLLAFIPAAAYMALPTLNHRLTWRWVSVPTFVALCVIACGLAIVRPLARVRSIWLWELLVLLAGYVVACAFVAIGDPLLAFLESGRISLSYARTLSRAPFSGLIYLLPTWLLLRYAVLDSQPKSLPSMFGT